MARLVIDLESGWFDTIANLLTRWRPAVASRPQITGDIADGNARYLEDIVIREDRLGIVLNIAPDQATAFTQSGNLRLSSDFEQDGFVEISFHDSTDGTPGGTTRTLKIELGGRDTSEPYRIDFTQGTAEANAFQAFRGRLGAQSGGVAATLTLDDGQGVQAGDLEGKGTSAVTAAAELSEEKAPAPVEPKATQDIPLPAANYSLFAGFVKRWVFDSSRPSVDEELLPLDTADKPIPRFLVIVSLTSGFGIKGVDISFDDAASGNDDDRSSLSPLFGSPDNPPGSFTITLSSGESLTLPAHNDSDPYSWVPASGLDVDDFDTLYAAISSSNADATLTLDNGGGPHPVPLPVSKASGKFEDSLSTLNILFAIQAAGKGTSAASGSATLDETAADAIDFGATAQAKFDGSATLSETLVGKLEFDGKGEGATSTVAVLDELPRVRFAGRDDAATPKAAATLNHLHNFAGRGTAATPKVAATLNHLHRIPTDAFDNASAKGDGVLPRARQEATLTEEKAAGADIAARGSDVVRGQASLYVTPPDTVVVTATHKSPVGGAGVLDQISEGKIGGKGRGAFNSVARLNNRRDEPHVQVIDLPAARYATSGDTKSWTFPPGSFPKVSDALTDLDAAQIEFGAGRWLRSVSFRDSQAAFGVNVAAVTFSFSGSGTSTFTAGSNLSDQFSTEEGGYFEVELTDGTTFRFVPDTANPYTRRYGVGTTNSPAEVRAFFNAMATSGQAARLTLNDNAHPLPVFPEGSAFARASGSATLDDARAAGVTFAGKASAAETASARLSVEDGIDFGATGQSRVTGSARTAVTFPERVRIAAKASARASGGPNTLTQDLALEGAYSAAVTGSATLSMQRAASVAVAGKGSAVWRTNRGQKRLRQTLPDDIDIGSTHQGAFTGAAELTEFRIGVAPVSGKGTGAVTSSATLDDVRPAKVTFAGKASSAETARATLTESAVGKIDVGATGQGTVTGAAVLVETEAGKSPVLGKSNGVFGGSANLTRELAAKVTFAGRASAAESARATLTQADAETIEVTATGTARMDGSATLAVFNPRQVTFAGKGTAAWDTARGRKRLTETAPDDVDFGATHQGRFTGRASLDILGKTNVHGRGTVAFVSAAELFVLQAARIAARGRAFASGAAVLTEFPKPVIAADGSAAVSGSARLTQVKRSSGTPEWRQQREARALSGVAQVFALEAMHDDLTTPVRIVADNAEHVVDGETYIPCAFRAEPPQSREGEVRQAELQIDNVGEKMMKWVRASRGGRGAVIRVMSLLPAEEGDTESVIDYEFTMDVGVARVTNDTISVTLTDEPVIGRPSVTIRHDPQTSPGLFPG